MINHSDLLRTLQLLQLADSALPIGGLSHSFGLESMTAEQLLNVDGLFAYLEDLLEEGLFLEAVYCRCAYSVGAADELSDLNAHLNALCPARESREASLAMGKRFLRLIASLEQSQSFREVAASGEVHLCLAFGFAGGVLTLGADETVGAFLSQSVSASISAAQRLLSLGQLQSSITAWDLKPAIEKVVQRSANVDISQVSAFSHLPELASMRHPFLSTRLFIS